MTDELDNSIKLDESFSSPNVDFMEVLKRKHERLRILQEMAEKQEERIIPLIETKKLKHKSKSETKRKVNTSFPQVALRRSLRFQNSPRKWNGTEAASKPFVPREFIPNDYGPIPGVEVGEHWETRMQCSAAGVHRPTVAGIHAGPKGAYSVALSGGYPEDVDNGDSFVYTGAGGRDLKGTVNKPKNLRIAPQTKDQELVGTNASLLKSIETKMPIRVIRGYKSPSFYAPEYGYRYDGLYQVVSYWADVGATGFRVYRFLMERLKDQDPPPWEHKSSTASETNSMTETCGQNDLMGAGVDVPRMTGAMLSHQPVNNISNNYEPVDKLPGSYSKIQIVPKETKFQGSKAMISIPEMKPHSTPATLLWLEKNYELAEGICIPRNTLYSHYIHFCKSNAMSPLNSASFGKIIRQAFPTLTTRRLGTRGQSRYHYYGIAVKDTSPYYDIAFSKMSFGCDGKKSLDRNAAVLTIPKHKETLKVWPQFPNMKEISFPPYVSQEKVTSFIIMYHTHCQRIFDTIVRGTLDDAYQFLEHFWQGVPTHLSDLLNTNTVVNMVGVCDSILYRTISNVLMPSVLKRCSDNVIHMIRNFADKLENWINSALTDVPVNLKSVKLKLGRRFCTTLRRQMVLYQLTHTAQVVLNNCEMMSHINKDWKRINLGPIIKQAFLFAEYSTDHIETIKYISVYWKDFQELTERQATVEDFTEKVENLVHKCIVEMSEKKKIPLRKVARTFILLWHVIESLISRDMTIHSAESFGSFHLIQTMFDEYMHYLVEMLHSEDVTKYLLKNVTLDILPDLDSNWNEFSETNCFELFTANSNLRSINISGESLEIVQGDFQTTNLSFCPGPELNFTKAHTVQTDCSYISDQCEYENHRKDDSEVKYNHSNSFSENIELTDFNSCDQDCVEFSAGIYCQEALQYNAHSLQYQSGSFNEGSNFECLN